MIETTNKTKLLGIFGTPIAHTLSPMMHSYMAKKSGIDMAYLAFDVLPEELETAVCGAKMLGATGFNITAPHKIEIMKYIDVISDEAQYMNSVNTIVNRDGLWYGYNTDGDGFCKSLLLEGHEICNKRILMMGAGGSARSLCYKLAQYGAKSISITARTEKNVHIIGEMIEKYTDTKFYDTYHPSDTYDMVINTTPLGMHPYEDKNPCDFMDMITEDVLCCDIIYNPNKTLFLKSAEGNGAKIVNGLGMLITQGILAFEHFHGVALDHKSVYDELMQLMQTYRI